MTSDLDKRLEQHQAGNTFDGYTHSRRPVKLVWYVQCNDPNDAIRLEKQIKGWSRKKKEALINDNYTDLVEFSKNYTEFGHPDNRNKKGLRQAQPDKKNILVLCTGNSCRSQMAHGYLEQFSAGKANVYSAGVETHGLNKNAIATMKDDGIDISHHTSNNVYEYLNIDFDIILTVCDHAFENCPYIPSKNAIRLHHNFVDPSKVDGTVDEIKKAFINTRDEIKEHCFNLINTHLN